MRKLEWWLQDITICGFEGEGDGGGDGQADEGTGETGDSGESGQGDPPEGQGETEDVTGLKSALAAERAAAKKAQADNKALQKRLASLEKADKERTDAELSEIDRLKKQQDESDARVKRLGAGYRETAITSAIADAARDLKFRDVKDAIVQVDRSAFGVEQDEEDPSRVEIDAKSVKAAVKKLADEKKYLLQAEGEALPSGSRFGGGANADKTTKSQEEMMKKYPALRGI